MDDNEAEVPEDQAENELHVRLMLEVRDKGCMDSFEQLVQLHQGAVIGTIAKMLGGDSHEAHDLAQQVFIRVWKSAGRYKPKAKFTTWLFTITRNLVFNELRRRSRRKEVSIEGQEEETHLQIPDEDRKTPDAVAQQRELQEAIDQAIEELPEKQRLAVVLRRYENMPYEEIAAVVGVSVSAVKSLLFRARAQLKEALQKHLRD